MAVHGGKVYALGGFDGVQRLASVESYDPFHNRWSQVHEQDCPFTCHNYVMPCLGYRMNLNIVSFPNIFKANQNANHFILKGKRQTNTCLNFLFYIY